MLLLPQQLTRIPVIQIAIGGGFVLCYKERPFDSTLVCVYLDTVCGRIRKKQHSTGKASGLEHLQYIPCC